eukprot:gene10103-13579_t
MIKSFKLFEVHTAGRISSQFNYRAQFHKLVYRSIGSSPLRSQSESTFALPKAATLNFNKSNYKFANPPHLKPAAPVDFFLPHRPLRSFADDIIIVREIQHARQIIEIMQKYSIENPNQVWACDTEVADIDLKTQGPIGNGEVICISIYGGDDVDFGNGPGKVLWIENIGDCSNLLLEFKEFFENDNYKKVWHNYGFDRHVMFNAGIDCRGFAGDTMHMARIFDSSRDRSTGFGGSGYSLESLSEDLLKGNANSIKVSMKELFGVSKLTKSGEESKIKTLPEIRSLQTDPLSRDKWIEYSARDAVSTWHLHKALKYKLLGQGWSVDNYKRGNMFDFYMKYIVDFGDLLTDMERNGIKVDTTGHLKEAESRARAERDRMEKLFLLWANEFCEDCKYINIASSVHMQQLLFGHYENQQLISSERVFTVDKTADEIIRDRELTLKINPYAGHSAAEIKSLLKERNLKISGSRRELMIRLLAYDRKVQLLQKFSTDDISNKCITLGLDFNQQSKDELIHMVLKTFGKTKKNNKETTSNVTNFNMDKIRASVIDKPYMKLKIDEIKLLLKERNLTLGKGKKSILVTKLLCNELNLNQTTLTNEYVISECEKYNINISDLSEELIIIEYLEYLRRAQNILLSNNNDNRIVESSDVVVIDDINDDYVIDNQELLDNNDSILMISKTIFSTHDEINNILNQPLERDDNNTFLPLELPKSVREINVKTIGLIPTDFTPTGIPQVSISVLRKLSGQNVFGEDSDKIKWGAAYNFFGGGEAGERACRALGALANVGGIDSTITNFLVPLQALVDKQSRIHCSLNLNTETGRLSSRRPNLQNQPALEKDQYKIRDAFIAEEGNTLIVADYGQLELRLMAHITKCKSMIEAFKSGGCFHSRTAMGMYDYIREAVDSKKVLLEWDYSLGQPTVPLVKDTYASERRKAKTLNFSIAYGKTVHGLAQDWGISKEEAQNTLDAWYNDRPEVKEWQLETQSFAKKKKYVQTLMGRRRILPDAADSGPAGGHSLRAAINTPIQGSAADVVMMAMIKLWKSEVLKRLGWKLLLQIHDEVILEGPKESKDEALKEVISCMENPFDNFGLMPLSVHLDVDAKSADSWYKAK